MQNLKFKIRFPKSGGGDPISPKFGRRSDLSNIRKSDILIIIIALLLILPAFILAEEGTTTVAPKTVDEAKGFAMAILSKLPQAVEKVWREEALPILEKMWQWSRPMLEPWRIKFLSLLNKEVEKRRPDIEQQFKEEKEEMQKDLWERFKSLVREAI